MEPVADKINLYKLVAEAESSSDVVTIEGTVDTGFEFLALDECKEAFGDSVNASRSRGRIFFNIPLSSIDQIKKLRSIDNLFLVAAAIQNLQFEKESKEDDLQKVKELVCNLDLKKSLSVWKSYMGFNGITFPTTEEFLVAEEKRKEIKAKATDESSANTEILHDCAGDNKNLPEENIPDVLKFRATCNRAGKHEFTSMDAARDFGGQLQDNYHWLVDLTNYNLEVVLNINDNEGYVTFALTKESMHRRNIAYFGPTTLRATHCYNMLRMAQIQAGDVVVDPLCGGGSIPIEGAVAFPNAFYIGGDIHEKAVSRSEMNYKHINTTRVSSIPMDIFQWDIGRLPLKTSSVDVFATDLPFGKRSGRKSDNRPLYTKAVNEMARVVRPSTGRAVLLTHDKKTLTQVLLKMARYWSQPRPFNINLGGIEGGVFLIKRTSKLYF